MSDVFDSNKRSDIMRQVKSRGNKSTEQKLIDFFALNHIIGWRRNYQVYGKPDFVFHAKKVAVFVDGCFWHGHTCRNTKPKQNQEYWTKKIAKNQARDKQVTEHLEKIGWKVIRIWLCDLLKKNYDQLTLKLSPLL